MNYSPVINLVCMVHVTVLYFVPICPALCFRALRYGPIEPERSISMYKSRGWSRSGVTVTENVCGSPGMKKVEYKKKINLLYNNVI